MDIGLQENPEKYVSCLVSALQDKSCKQLANTPFLKMLQTSDIWEWSYKITIPVKSKLRTNDTWEILATL